jgi:serine phosphatase RsbU (regulator of sigma subunit)
MKSFIFFFLIIIVNQFVPNCLYSQTNAGEFEELANDYVKQGKASQSAEFYGKSGYAYWNAGNTTKAITLFQKAYDIFYSLNNFKAAVVVANNIGLLYLDDNNYKSAYTQFNNVLTLNRKTKNPIEIYNSLVNVASVSVELSNYNDVIAKTEEALAIAKESNSLKMLAKCYSLLAENYEKMGDADNAFKYFELYSSIDKKIKSQEMEDLKQMSDEEINKAHEKKRIAEIELKIKKGELKLTQDSLAVSEKLAYETRMQVELRNEQLKKKEIQLKYERQVKRTLIFGLTITGIFLLIIGGFLVQKLKDNKKLKLQKEEITQQRNTLNHQNKKITDSIHYGLRIQQAMLPNITDFNEYFNTAIIYKPKDIVSGDFYWCHKIITPDKSDFFVSVVDCTGHGVPGAFMSMIGHRLFNEVVVENGVTLPSKILETVNLKLKKDLDQENTKSMDGMDVAFCHITINRNNRTEVVFAGAKRPLLIQHANNEITLIEGDRRSIGGFAKKAESNYTDKFFTLELEDRLFLFSDGIIDQQNYRRERFGTQKLTELIIKNRDLSLNSFTEKLQHEISMHMENEEQRDDITFLGIQIKQIKHVAI